MKDSIKNTINAIDEDLVEEIILSTGMEIGLYLITILMLFATYINFSLGLMIFGIIGIFVDACFIYASCCVFSAKRL